MLQRSVLTQNAVFHSLLAVALILGSGCSQPTEPGASQAAPARLTATDLSGVHRLYIENSPCAARLRVTLAGHQFDTSPDGQADALLSLTLFKRRPLRESLPLIGSLGAWAQYRADIRGADGQPLLSIYGQEGSLTLNELCDDIGDEIADSLAAARANQHRQDSE